MRVGTMTIVLAAGALTAGCEPPVSPETSTGIGSATPKPSATTAPHREADTARTATTTAAAGTTTALPPIDRTGPLDERLERLLPAYRDALVGVRSFVDSLHVDPMALRADGIKGKKKLAELLHVYRALLALASPEQRAALSNRIRSASAVTNDPRFHDMATVDAKAFKEDATSYLRCAYLMDKAGFDTTYYRAEIAKVVPRLDGHLSDRGVHQRLAFGMYYRYFGIPFPPAARATLADGVIASRKPAAAMSRFEAYRVTHEILVPFDFGDRLDVEPFSADDLAYLRATMNVLLQRWEAAGDVDLLAELLSTSRYARLARDLPHYGLALEHLLRSQNADGSFGAYPELAARFSAEHIKYRLILHTTMVALDALASGFAGVTP